MQLPQEVGLGLPQSALRQRLIDVAGVSLGGVLAADPRLRLISPRLDHLLSMGAGRKAHLRKDHWAGLLSSGMVRYLTEQFQYVDLRGQIASLEKIYRSFLEGLAHGGPDQALEQHHERLLAWTQTQLAAVGALHLVRETGCRPVCSQYSPELQLQVLGVEANELADPVLDLGCGDGRLVQHLRALGHVATGIDRNAPAELLRGEWFDAPLYEERWGTIIAHQSVSLHFQSAHYGAASRADEYARFYMRILRALRPGGQFLYAPRVPFFEPALGGLGGRFLVSHRSPFQGAESTAVTREFVPQFGGEQGTI